MADFSSKIVLVVLWVEPHPLNKSKTRQSFHNYLFFTCSPYSSADLRLMAGSFNTTVVSLEDELMTLILEGKIQARIDSHNKV